MALVQMLYVLKQRVLSPGYPCKCKPPNKGVVSQGCLQVGFPKTKGKNQRDCTESSWEFCRELRDNPNRKQKKVEFLIEKEIKICKNQLGGMLHSGPHTQKPDTGTLLLS